MTGAIDTVILWFFVGTALLGAALMLFLRHPMRVALSLIGVMLSLAGIYGLLGVHAAAVFQVLVYVGAIMVFMVFVIMLLDVRDSSFLRRTSRLLIPGITAALLLLAAFAGALGAGALDGPPAARAGGGAAFAIGAFSAAFLEEHWLEFELTSVLLVAAVVAVLAVLKKGGKSHG